MMYYVLSIISILFVGCTTAYRGDRVEKVRVGIPALFAVEVDYFKDMDNKNVYSNIGSPTPFDGRLIPFLGRNGEHIYMTPEEETKYWISQNINPWNANPSLPPPGSGVEGELMDRND